MAPSQPTSTPSMVPIDQIFESAQTPNTSTHPRDMSNKATIIWIILIPSAVIFVLVLGIVYSVRKRNARIIAARKLTPGTEMIVQKPLESNNTSFTMPHRPTCSINKAMPPLPQVHTKLSNVYTGRSSPLADNGVSATETPLSFFHPRCLSVKGKARVTPRRV